MKLPDLRNFDLREKKVLVRVDYDVPLRESFDSFDVAQDKSAQDKQEWEVADDSRILASLPTIQYLLTQNAKVILLAHLGRPEGETKEEFSLKPVAQKLQKLLPQTNFQFSIFPFDKLRILSLSKDNFQSNLNDQILKMDGDVILLENLRFDKGEEANDLSFAQKLASLGDFYINDAFAVSHREHASVVGLPKLLPHAAGLQLKKEVMFLSSVFEDPKRPVVLILGGVKEDKLAIIPGFLTWVDRILIGGLLPTLIKKNPELVVKDQKIDIGTLAENGLDIDIASTERFVTAIQGAGTVIWAGPLGKTEAPEGQKATQIIGAVLGQVKALKIAGGGDTEAALTNFKMLANMDYVSTGGTAMLEFLAYRQLPGLEVLQ